MNRPTVSATLLTYNSEDTLERCLESIQWVDEIVVVDSLSTDRTLEIASRYADRTLRRPWAGFISQRNFSKEQVTGEWILWVDSDEVVPPALREEMETELRSVGTEIQGFEVPRCTFYLGRWIRHGGWYPDLSVRLFRSEGHWWGGEEPHPAIQITGPVKRLKKDLWHFSYASFGQQIRTIDRYAWVSAQQRYRKGESFRLRKMLLHPLWRFIKEYLLLQGFRDGMPGLIIVVATMFYVFSKYAKLWDLQRTGGDKGP